MNFSLTGFSSSHRSKDLNQIFSELSTFIILSFGLLTLLFIYFLGGWDGFYAVFEWADETNDALFALFGPAGLFLSGLIMLVLGFHEYGEYSLIRNTPTSTVRSAPMGRVEVKGEVHPLDDENLLEAPFTGEECLGYDCLVEEYHSDDDGGNWHTVHMNRRTEPFVLEDPTGKLVVEPEEAEWGIGSHEFREIYYEDSAPPRIQSFVEREIDSEKMLDFDLMGGDKLRFSENRIPLDEELYVLGGARPLEEQLNGDERPDDAEILIKRNQNTGMFYLSEQSENEILSSKKWIILGLLGGGFVVTPASAVTLCYVLGVL